jgi:ribonuclease P protein component
VDNHCRFTCDAKGYPRRAARPLGHHTFHRDDGCGTVAHASKTLQALREELRWLTVREAVSTLCRFDEWHEERVHEADVSTESTAAREDARLSRSHEHQGRAQGAQAPPRQGSQTAHGVAGRFPRRERLTSSAEFQALFQRGRRIDRPALIVLWREATETTRVGFAVSRQVKNAVQRNRARRRLREAYRASRDAAPAQIRMVIVGRPAALKAPFVALTGQLRAALGAIPGPRPSA